MRTATAVRLRSILLLSCVAFLHAAARAQEGVRLERPEPIMLDLTTGSGSGLIVLSNPSGAAADVLLSAGTLTNTATRQEAKASVTFSGINETAGSRYFEAKVPAGKPLPVRVEISGLNEAGEVTVDLLNNGAPMKLNDSAQQNAQLRAINYRFPFSVNVAPESQTLRLAPGIPSQVVLVNDDEMPYSVEWRLLVSGKPLDPQAADAGFTKEKLPAKGSKPLPLRPPESLFSDTGGWLSSLFREETADAMLEIRPRLRDGLDNTFLPVKGIPLKARLGYWSPLPQQLAGTSVIFAVLLAGGVTSLLLSYFLPNLLRRRDLKDRLQAVDSSAGGISDRIDSRLRVLMRVERRRLKELLKSVPVTSPDMNRLFGHCEQGIGLLESRVNLIEELDNVYDRLVAAQTLCPPPSLKDRVEQHLWKAAALLSEPNPQESDFQVARTLVSEAKAGTERLNLGDEEFKKDLTRRLAELFADIYPNGPATLTGKLTDLFAQLPGPFDILKKYNGKEFPQNLFSVIDVNLSVLTMLRDYALLYDGTMVQSVRQKLDAHEGELLGLLSLQSWASVRNGRLLLRQMKEGIYASDVLDAIRSDGVTMEVSPQLLRPFEPARFSVRFLRPDIDGSAARDQFQCEWVFDERYEERGWDITHYFATAKTYKVRAWFVASDGQVVTPLGSPEKVKVERDIPVLEDRGTGKWDRLIAEWVRLMIALFIALLGLITGAQDQLSKMDFIPGMITVFLLGFSADAIKNLLTQRTQPPT
jgi:hypothetical protein